MRKIDKLSVQLQKTLIQKAQSRAELKGEIVTFIMQEFKVNPRSQFIPPAIRRQIVDAVYHKYRSQMDDCGVLLNYNLQFAK